MLGIRAPCRSAAKSTVSQTRKTLARSTTKPLSFLSVGDKVRIWFLLHSLVSYAGSQLLYNPDLADNLNVAPGFGTQCFNMPLPKYMGNF